jgi:hypothetical protein
MRNPIGELGPQVLLLMKYLDEVKYASTRLFSFPLFSEKVCGLSQASWKRS